MPAPEDQPIKEYKVTAEIEVSAYDEDHAKGKATSYFKDLIAGGELHVDVKEL